MEVDINFSHKHSIDLLLEQVPLTTTPVFLMQEFPQPVTEQVITLTKTSNSNLSFAFCFDWTLLKNVYQKWRHIISTIQCCSKPLVIGNKAAFYKSFIFWTEKKGKGIFGISFKCNKIYFYEFFDAKFRLEETRELPLCLGNGWS